MKKFYSVLLGFFVLVSFSASTAMAAPASISVLMPPVFELLNDADPVGIANINDTLRLTAEVFNTDGGCVTTVTVDLTAYGHGPLESLACTVNNAGNPDTYQIDFVLDEGTLDADPVTLRIPLVHLSDIDDILGIYRGPSTLLAEALDNDLPDFAAVDPVVALKQDGTLPAHGANLWYYYNDGDHLKVRLSTDSADTVKATICFKSLVTNTPNAVCEVGDFSNLISTATLGGAGPYNFDLDLSALPGGWPTHKAGYRINFQLEDDAGNVWSSTNDAEFFTAVFNINPIDDDPFLYDAAHNLLTTDFSAIDDFTDIAGLVFNAVDATDPLNPINLGKMTITGPINLTDPDTLTALQDFALNVTVSDTVMRVDSDAIAALNLPATLVMYMRNAVQPGLIVKNNLGDVVGYVPNTAAGADSFVFDGDTVDGFIWDDVVKSFTYEVDGFSEFEADNSGPTAGISPANGATNIAVNTNVVVTFNEPVDTATFTYTLLPDPGGKAVTWSPDDKVATITHAVFGQGGAYTFTVTGAEDLTGNNIAGPIVSAFTTASTPAAAAPAVSGSAGGRREGSNLNKVKVKKPETEVETKKPTTTAATTETSSSYAGKQSQFNDIAGHWGENYIKQMEQEGFLHISQDKKFYPDEFITRGQAAKLIASWMKPDLSDCTKDPYSDVSCSGPYGKYVDYLKQQNLMAGYMDGSFKPDEKVSREYALNQLLKAKILMETSILNVLNPFSDVKLGDWFYDIVMIGYKLDIIQGYPDGTFRPTNPATRAEFAKMFVKTLL